MKKHFLRIADSIDVFPILHVLNANPDLWDENKLRTTHPASPHQETSDIWVLFNKLPDNPEEVANDIEVIPYRAWAMLPHLRNIIFDLMRRVEGMHLGRVIITRLKPGAKIPPHIDQGAPAEYYSRYQLAIQSFPGALFTIEDETVNFKTGELWKINNRAEHGVINNSAEDRLVCIIDIRTAAQC